MPYPGVYPDDDKIIPHSPRKEFGFASEMMTDKVIKLESMKNISIDQVIQLYKYGYKIEDTSPTIATTQGGIYISTGVILLGIGLIGLIYYLKTKGKM